MGALPSISASLLADTEVADPVYAFAEEAAHASSAAELDAAMARSLKPFHIGNFVLYRATDRMGQPSPAKLAGVGHEAWRGHYFETGLAARDDLLRHGETSIAPVTWTQFRRTLADAPEKMRIYHEAASFGLKDGFYLPIRQADGSTLGVAMMVSHTLPTNPGMLATLHMIAICYTLAAERLGLTANAAPAGKMKLTRRQAECLQWIAAGKTSTEIAAILGLSEHTVNEHLEAARNRLGVRTTTQAVLAAAMQGLIRT
jgi:LuxR family quorum sensing-dependent transcriptional regulator